MKKTDIMSDVEALLSQLREQGHHVQFGQFDIHTLPTGISSFDVSTQVGGVPCRRLTLIQGEEASGKTLILLALIAQAQRAGGVCAFVDLEHALTPSFAALMGVDFEKLVVHRPTTLDEAYDVTRALVQSGLFAVVGFDSTTALTTKASLALSASDTAARAEEAGMHSRELKKLCSAFVNECAVVMISQLREDPAPPNWWPSGVPRLYSPGGRALRHYASMVVLVKTRAKYKDSSGQQIGNRVSTEIKKNKVGPPFGRAEFDLFYSTGVDLLTDAMEAALAMGIIEKKSSWRYFEAPDDDGEIQRLAWNGGAAMEAAFRGDPHLRAVLLARVSDAQSVPDSGAETDDTETDPTKAAWDGVSDG